MVPSPLDGCPCQKPRLPFQLPPHSNAQGGHCNSCVLLPSFCLLLSIHISYLINWVCLPWSTSSCLSAMHSLLCHQSHLPNHTAPLPGSSEVPNCPRIKAKAPLARSLPGLQPLPLLVMSRSLLIFTLKRCTFLTCTRQSPHSSSGQFLCVLQNSAQETLLPGAHP